MAPTLVLCSRNARPKKGLVRRPHVDQYGCPSQRKKQASLEGSIRMDDSCLMRAVGDRLGCPLSLTSLLIPVNDKKSFIFAG